MTDDREYEFVCDVCKRELYVMPTYDHDQIDGEEWFHKDDSTVACDAWEVAPDLYEEVQTLRAQLAALRDELEALRDSHRATKGIAAMFQQQCDDLRAEIERLKGTNDNLTDAMDQAVTYLKVVTDAMYECVFCGETKDEEGHREGCEVTAALVIMESRTNSVTAQVATLTAENAELKRRKERAEGWRDELHERWTTLQGRLNEVRLLVVSVDSSDGRDSCYLEEAVEIIDGMRLRHTHQTNMVFREENVVGSDGVWSPVCEICGEEVPAAILGEP